MMKFRQVKIVDTRPDRIISSWREGAPNSSANRINHGAVRASSFCEVWQGGPSWGRGGASIGSPSHPPTASAIGVTLQDCKDLEFQTADVTCLNDLLGSGSQFSPFHTSQLDS